MGACASKPESCVGGKLKFSKRYRKTRRSRLKKSLSFTSNKLVPINESSGFNDLPSYTNPAFRGTIIESCISRFFFFVLLRGGFVFLFVFLF